jgi:hypothetical protein
MASSIQSHSARSIEPLKRLPLETPNKNWYESSIKQSAEKSDYSNQTILE